LKIFGRNLFWYTIVFGTIAAISRKVVADELQVIDPEGAMCLVVQQTHYMPKRWRGKESSELVRREFETLFQVHVLWCCFELVVFKRKSWLTVVHIPQFKQLS
jgi:autophagy-related protein 9